MSQTPLPARSGHDPDRAPGEHSRDRFDRDGARGDAHGHVPSAGRHPGASRRREVGRRAWRMWLPSDLASASERHAPTSPTSPCPSAECTFGSNALQLTWDDGTGVTTVSYRYGPAGDGMSFILTRVECKGGVVFVARRLARPVTTGRRPRKPRAVEPRGPRSRRGHRRDHAPRRDRRATPTERPTDSTRAQRVIVNVNGAPGADGTDRSSSVSFTAGGASIELTRADHVHGPDVPSGQQWLWGAGHADRRRVRVDR